MKESWKVFVIQKVWVRFDLPPLCTGAASDLPQLVPTRCGAVWGVPNSDQMLGQLW